MATKPLPKNPAPTAFKTAEDFQDWMRQFAPAGIAGRTADPVVTKFVDDFAAGSDFAVAWSATDITDKVKRNAKAAQLRNYIDKKGLKTTLSVRIVQEPAAIFLVRQPTATRTPSA
jgi:hypothetical protein